MAFKNPVPIIAVVGEDGVGKTTFSKMLAKDLNFQWHNFPSDEFPSLRMMAKSDMFNVNKTKDVPLLPNSRMLAHALSHSLSFDLLKHQITHGQIGTGIVFDRYWYCNVAYIESKPGLRRTYVIQAEKSSDPFVPDIVIFVKTPENMVFGRLEATQNENVLFRANIVQNYMNLLSDEKTFSSITTFHFTNDPKRDVHENYKTMRKYVVDLLNNMGGKFKDEEAKDYKRGATKGKTKKSKKDK